MDFFKFEQALLYPYVYLQYDEDDTQQSSLSSLFKKVSSGSYVEALHEEECQKAFLFQNTDPVSRPADKEIYEYYKQSFCNYLKLNTEDGQKVLFCIGVCCLQLFTQNNFCGPLVGPKASSILPGLFPTGQDEENTKTHALKELVLDTEGIYCQVAQPELLILAKLILFDLRNSLSSCESVNWWCSRYCIVHQKVADEQSPVIYDALIDCLEKTENQSNLFQKGYFRDLSALFHLEAGHCHLHYYHVGKAKEHFEKALSILCMEISLTGALGVRTKWQQHGLAQLIATVSYVGCPIKQEEQKGPVLLPSDLPSDIVLNDETRLNKIKFEDQDQDVVPSLSPLEQMAFLANFVLKAKSQAQYDGFNEEAKAYLSALLQYPKNWSLQITSLSIRSKIESSEIRAMERSLQQLEELVNAIKREEPSRFERLKLIYCSHYMPQWHHQQELARMYMRLGCTKTALEIFEKLNLWEDIIICYNDLEMRHRAADIIRKLLDKEETPKLWCLMGDATDDIECYNKAFELSDRKSGKAQRCLGNYYYVRRDYTKAMEHFELSVQLNTLQFPVWQRLAYCALQTESWERCASAYLRCSVLEPENFECWNNMSQAYLKLGYIKKAWRSLQEALRYKIDNWRLWDNYMLVSTSLGYMTQALNAYNQILRLKEKHVDSDILGRIVDAIISDKKDPDELPMKNLHKKCLELLGKLTREVPTHGELWYLYGELNFHHPSQSKEVRHSAMQHYRKSVAADSQKHGWEKEVNTALIVLMRALKLAEVAKEVSHESDPKAAAAELSSIRMLVRSVVATVRRGQTDAGTGCLVEALKQPLLDVEQELDQISELVEHFKAQN